MTCWRIFELSTQVTKSSNVRDTKKAGSLTTSVPTRMCPCSIKSVAFLMYSDILSAKRDIISKKPSNQGSPRCHLLLTITTGRRLRQKLLADMFTALLRSHLVGINPSTYSFSRSWALISVRNGSFPSISLIFFASSRIVLDNLLYLRNCCNNNFAWFSCGIYALENLLGVIFALTNVKFPHYFCFVQIVVGGPIHEINLLQQFLFMILQFSHHFRLISF